MTAVVLLSSTKFPPGVRTDVGKHLRPSRYVEYLRAAIEGIKEMQSKTGGQAMFLNLGRIFNADTYSMFSQKAITVVEIPGTDTAWERPPGLGVFPLSVIFEVCKTIQHFLSFDEDNSVVSSAWVPLAPCVLSNYAPEAL